MEESSYKTVAIATSDECAGGKPVTVTAEGKVQFGGFLPWALLCNASICIRAVEQGWTTQTSHRGVGLLLLQERKRDCGFIRLV